MLLVAVMKPTILIPPENRTVTAGQTGSILLRCPSTGSSEPTVSWLFNGKYPFFNSFIAGVDNFSFVA